MFTPPPSPLPLPRIVITDDSSQAGTGHDDVSESETPLSNSDCSSPYVGERDEKRMYEAQAAAAEVIIQTYERKRRTARRTRWAVLLVPAVLILVALTSRRLTTLDALYDLELALGSREVENSRGEDSLGGWREDVTQERHNEVHHHNKRQTITLSDPVAPSSSVLFSSIPPDASPSAAASDSPSTTIPQTEQTIPPVPDASNPPALPTPFPQPFDTTGPLNNLTTQTCANFFTNMTQQLPFRSCRPFSLLEQFSDEFIESQTNLTLLNTLIFGTCTTTTPADTCIANMDWFASSLQSECSTELSQNNQMVRQTLLGLQSYALLRTSACLVNQQSNTYCYASAAHSSSPADLYYYQLPLGIGFPVSTTQPSCSACAKSVLGLYADAVKAGNESMGGLGATYESAARQAESVCGSGFAPVGLATNGVSAARRRCSWLWMGGKWEIMIGGVMGMFVGALMWL